MYSILYIEDDLLWHKNHFFKFMIYKYVLYENEFVCTTNLLCKELNWSDNCDNLCQFNVALCLFLLPPFAGLAVAGVCLVATSYAGCDAFLPVLLFCVGLAFLGFCQSGFNINHLDIAPQFAGECLGRFLEHFCHSNVDAKQLTWITKLRIFLWLRQLNSKICAFQSVKNCVITGDFSIKNDTVRNIEI